MDKLLTEYSVRQLMKQNKLTDNAQITLPRGTILTPSARSFLGEHQIKIEQGGSDIVETQHQIEDKNVWMNDIKVNYPTIDFNKIDHFATPLIRLQYCLRKQFLLVLTLLDQQNKEVDQEIVTNLVKFVNEIVAVDFDQIVANDDYSVSNLKLMDLSLSEPNTLGIQMIQESLAETATTINTYILVQPNMAESTYCQTIVSWENMLQDWTKLMLEGGDGNARFKRNR